MKVSSSCAGCRFFDWVGRYPNVWLWRHKLWNEQRCHFSGIISRRTGPGLNAYWAGNAEPFKLGDLCSIAFDTARIHPRPGYEHEHDDAL
jgi:hypothetical protein